MSQLCQSTQRSFLCGYSPFFFLIVCFVSLCCCRFLIGLLVLPGIFSFMDSYLLVFCWGTKISPAILFFSALFHRLWTSYMLSNRDSKSRYYFGLDFYQKDSFTSKHVTYKFFVAVLYQVEEVLFYSVCQKYLFGMDVRFWQMLFLTWLLLSLLPQIGYCHII